MDKVNSILMNVEFVDRMTEIDSIELGRIYCKHGIAHALDVAKIMIKRNGEVGAGIDKNVLYATALLHDIGRADKDAGQNHACLGASLAAEIVKKSGYSQAEIDEITFAIAEHRQDNKANALSEILYFADKKSRTCYECEAADTCKWSMDKRNKSRY